jgi:peptide/nickel transport system permease protein
VTAARRKTESYTARVWRELRRNRRAFSGLWIVAVLAVVAVVADFVANDKPYYIEVEGEHYFPVLIDYGVMLGLRTWPEPLLNADYERLAEKATRVWWAPIPYSSTGVDIRGDIFESPSREHWLGTDRLGRDVAAGMIHGARISLTIGIVVVTIQATIGILLGGIAGYYGGWVDLVLSRIFELVLGIPTFFLIITAAAILPPSIYILMAILGFTGWVGIARLIRSEFLKVRAQEFVVAAQGLGGSDARVMLRQVEPLLPRDRGAAAPGHLGLDPRGRPREHVRLVARRVPRGRDLHHGHRLQPSRGRSPRCAGPPRDGAIG